MFANVKKTLARGANSLRFLYTEPRPSLSRAELEAQIAAAKTTREKARAFRGVHHGTRNWLSEKEQRVFGRARRTGVLRLVRGCTSSVTEQYERWCFNVGRPFLAVSVHGDVVFFDSSHASGLGDGVKEERSAAALEAARAAFGQVASRALVTPIEISVADSVAKADKSSVGGVEEGKEALLTEINSRCAIRVSGRGDALRFASGVFQGYCEATDHLSAADIHDKLVSRAQRRAWRREELHRLVLRKARDRMPEVRMNLPKGIFDPFTQADEEGISDRITSPRPPFGKRHYFDRKGRRKPGTRDPEYYWLVEQARNQLPERE